MSELKLIKKEVKNVMSSCKINNNEEENYKKWLETVDEFASDKVNLQKMLELFGIALEECANALEKCERFVDEMREC